MKDFSRKTSDMDSTEVRIVKTRSKGNSAYTE